MKIRRLMLLIVSAACLSGFTEKDIEEARQWSHKTKDALWACLQAEVRNKLTLRMKPDDFAIYIKGACPREAQAFRVPFVDYLAMKFPNIDGATHLAQVESAIAQWRNAAVSLYVESLYKPR